MRLALGQHQCGDAGSGSGVAPDGLKQQGTRARPRLSQLFGDYEAVLFVGDEERRCETARVGDAPHGLLQQAVIAEQPQQLLGIKGA